MTNIGNNKDSSENYLKHYNKLVDSFDQDSKTSNIFQNSSQKSRVRVARVDDNLFIEPEKVKRKHQKKKFIPNMFSQISSCTLSTKIFSIILFIGVVRLIIMDHGIINYYEKKGILEERYQTIQQLKEENQDIIKEINRAKVDTKYLRNLAREQLGVISSEEYLILFAPKNTNLSK